MGEFGRRGWAPGGDYGTILGHLHHVLHVLAGLLYASCQRQSANSEIKRLPKRQKQDASAAVPSRRAVCGERRCRRTAVRALGSETALQPTSKHIAVVLEGGRLRPSS